MTEPESDGLQDPKPLRDKIDRAIGELLDLNQRITMVLRGQAKDFELIGGTYQGMANRSFEIASDIVALSVMASSNTGDIIMAEFGVVLGDEGEDEEDD